MQLKILASLLGMILSISTCFANKTFDSMVIFGDSLSDNGNLYRYMWGYLPLSPPYFEGHFSNGPIWAEHLYQQLYGNENSQGLQDYAVGGAGAVLSYKENLPYTLGTEISNYLYWHKFANPERSLFTIWIGANNYLNGPQNIESLTSGVVDAIGNAVEKLIARGADKFIIGNLPDLGRTPHALIKGNADLLSKLTTMHNDKLARKYAELTTRFPNATFLFIDAYSLFAEAIRNPKKYGFINTTDPCYPGSYTGWLNVMQITPDMVYSQLKRDNQVVNHQKWVQIIHNPQLMTAAKIGYVYQNLPLWQQEMPLECDGYLFWDHVHPSTLVHKRIAEYVAELIEHAGLQAINMPTEPAENRGHGTIVSR